MHKVTIMVEGNLSTIVEVLSPLTTKIEIERMSEPLLALPMPSFEPKHKPKKANGTVAQRETKRGGILSITLPPVGTVLSSHDFYDITEKAGYARGSAYYLMKELESAGRIVRIHRAQNPALGSTFRVEPEKAGSTTPKRGTISELVLAPKGTVMQQHEIGRLLPGIGWSPRSVDWACKELIRQDRLKKVGTGRYEVLQTRGS